MSKEEEAKVFLAFFIMLRVKADTCGPRKCKGDLEIKAVCCPGIECQISTKASCSVITSLRVSYPNLRLGLSVAQMQVGMDSSWYQTNIESEKVTCERLVVANFHLVSVMAAFEISLYYYY